jgi:hypothetical protein
MLAQPPMCPPRPAVVTSSASSDRHLRKLQAEIEDIFQYFVLHPTAHAPASRGGELSLQEFRGAHGRLRLTCPSLRVDGSIPWMLSTKSHIKMETEESEVVSSMADEGASSEDLQVGSVGFANHILMMPCSLAYDARAGASIGGE